MAIKKLKSIKGRTIRVTRLDECGVPVIGVANYIVTDGFISVTLSAEVEAGEEFTQKNAWGDFCVSEKSADLYKWINVAIQLCEVDPELLDMIGNANPVISGTDTIGATFGPASNPQAFAIEVWTKKAGVNACVGGVVGEWGYFVVPYIRNGTLDGDVVIENGPMTLGLKGEGIAAVAGWGTGPYDNPMRATFPVGDLWGMVVTDVQPPLPTVGAQTSGPATLGTAGIPGFFTPPNAPATVAALIAGTPNVVVASPTAVWTTGQYVQTDTVGVAGRAHWNGTAWVTGAKP